jgi:hypothetical protein
MIGKKIGKELKNYIKASNAEYLEKLKLETEKGFKEYYDELMKRVYQEYHEQESQQNEVKTTLAGYDKKKQDMLIQVILFNHRKKRRIIF